MTKINPKKGFKAFNKGLKCKNKQYEENTEYKIKGQPILCEKGFHYCENPLDVLNYYNLCDSEFAEVEDLGDTETDDLKNVTNHIKIKARVDLKGFIKASIDFLFEKNNIDENTQAASGDSSQLAASGNYSKLAASGHYSKLAASGNSSQLAASGDYSQLAASGYYSQLAASGDYSKLAASGYYSQLAASGDYSKLAASGENSICAAIGNNSQAKGIKGTWIVLAEYDNNYIVKCVKSAKIDGKKLKADTWYKLVNKKFTEVK